MPDDKPTSEEWLQVIGKALAYLCVQEVAKSDPKRVPDLPAKVKFLEDMGLNKNDAARVMGTTANSIQTNLRNRERAKVIGGKKKKR